MYHLHQSIISIRAIVTFVEKGQGSSSGPSVVQITSHFPKFTNLITIQLQKKDDERLNLFSGFCWIC